MEKSWHASVFRDLSATLDRIVYNFISVFYKMLMDLANIDILSTDTVSEFYTKIYTLIGLFMLFKVSFSFINYIVNPDMFLDKQKGAKKVFINIILSLAMLSVAPFGFSLLSQVQSAILADNVIPRFFLGNADDQVLENEFWISDEYCKDKKEASIADSQGDFISILAFRPFFQVDKDKFDKNLTLPDGYCAAYSKATVANYLQSDIYNGFDKAATGNKRYYVVDYKIFISTICGVVVALLLLSFCFDIAVRSIKLGFLELIAPIPIISYMDPKSGKDGMFNKWLKEVWSTWVDLFVRLAAVFMAIFIISLLDSNKISLEGTSTPRVWLMLFIIIGALMFAKKLPSLIESITGIKLSSSIQLNPFKKVSNEALGGKAIVGGVGAIGAAGLGIGMAGAAHGLAYANKRKEIAKAMGKVNAAQSDLDAAKNDRVANQLRYNSMHRRDNILSSRIASASSSTEKAKLQHEQNQLRAKMRDTDSKIKAGMAAEAAKSKVLNSAEEKLKTASNSKLYRHPVRGAIGEMSASAYTAMKSGYKSPSKVFANASAGSKAGIDRRNYYEKFDFMDKVHDKYTDFTGIRGDSGTTSEIKNEIKGYKNQLASTEQYIEMLNRNISNVAGKNFGSAVTMVGDKFSLAADYTGADREDLNNIINTYNQQIENRADLTAQINKLEKLTNKDKK